METSKKTSTSSVDQSVQKNDGVKRKDPLLKIIIGLLMVFTVWAIIRSPLLNPLDRTSTATWKTYPDTKNGFSIQYPQSWTPLKTPEGQAMGFIAPVDPFTMIQKRSPYMYLVQMLVTSSQDFVIEHPSNNPDIIDETTIQVDGTTGYYQTRKLTNQQTKQWTPTKVFIIVNGDHALSLNYVIQGKTDYTEEDLAKYEDIFKTMISTIKFTNQKQTSDTSNWETYTNNTYGYSIKYPSESFLDCSQADTFSLHKKSNPSDICAAGEGPYEGVSIYKTEGDTTANQTPYPDCFVPQKEAIQIGDIHTTRFTNTLKTETKEDFLRCNKNAIAYSRLPNYISLTTKKGENLIIASDATPGEMALINKIISTFTFTDQSQAINTSSWKTYTNKDLGFSIQYPINWGTPVWPCHTNNSVCFNVRGFDTSNYREKLNKIGGAIGIFRGENYQSSFCGNSCTKTTIHGLDVLKKIEIRNDGFDNDETEIFYIVRGEQYYQLTGTFVRTDQITEKEIDQILSTFSIIQ